MRSKNAFQKFVGEVKEFLKGGKKVTNKDIENSAKEKTKTKRMIG